MSKSKIVAIHNNDEDACLPETGPRQLALKAGKVTVSGSAGWKRSPWCDIN